MLEKTKSCMKFLLVYALIITLVLTVQTSISWIDRIMIHRDTDPKMFNQLIVKQKSGEQILWVIEFGKEIVTKETFTGIDQMKFRRYQIFLDYYGEYHKKRQHFLFEKGSDYSKIMRISSVVRIKQS